MEAKINGVWPWEEFLPIDEVARARAFAAKVLEGKVRSDGTQMQHAEDVAMLVKAAGGQDFEIAGGYLHDTDEDVAEVTNDDIRRIFGRRVARLVHGLTDPPEIAALHSLERKHAQAMRLWGMRGEESVKLVKIADQTPNMRTVAVSPPADWGRREAINYMYGAWMVVQPCRGINAFLEAEFDKAFEAAQRAYCDGPRLS